MRQVALCRLGGLVPVMSVTRPGKQKRLGSRSFMYRNPDLEPRGEVVDLFCGVGGLSHGLMQAGFEIKAGYDTDVRCKFAYETNNLATFAGRDVSTLTADEIRAHYSGDRPSVLAGCAPCQPFSTYNHRYGEDSRWSLLEKFSDLAAGVKPDIVMLENVPALAHYKGGRVFRRLVGTLEEAGYSVAWTIAKCEEFEVPQRRRRLVLIAAFDRRALPLSASRTRSISVRDAIGNLPFLSAGQVCRDDKLHAASALSELNLRRIKASTPGGTWRDWPKELRAACHNRPSGRTYPSVYARMKWDEPAPTITTQCYGYGNGRFGHPEQDRAISLREAAILQSFPKDYRFLPDSEVPTFKEVGRWIGNAVPVRLGKAIGRQIARIQHGEKRPVHK